MSTTATTRHTRKIEKAIRECETYIDREYFRNPVTRPAWALKTLLHYIAHREKLIAQLDEKHWRRTELKEYKWK